MRTKLYGAIQDLVKIWNDDRTYIQKELEEGWHELYEALEDLSRVVTDAPGIPGEQAPGADAPPDPVAGPFGGSAGTVGPSGGEPTSVHVAPGRRAAARFCQDDDCTFKHPHRRH